MEETTTATTRNRPTGLLVALALILAVAAVWATTALARGGSGPSPSQPAGGTADPWSIFVQDHQGGSAPSADDCPERDGGGSRGSDGSGGSGGDSGSDGSSNPSL
jgi:uncharacterized membrane protein YgcG